jgi:hypothetical protein
LLVKEGLSDVTVEGYKRVLDWCFAVLSVLKRFFRRILFVFVFAGGSLLDCWLFER